MLYDQDISLDVSLSRVLDAFAYDNEPPEVVISYLSMYPSSIKSILCGSLVKSRILCVDFLHKCTYDQVKWIAGNFKSLPRACACDLAWQAADKRSGVRSDMLIMFREHLADILKSDTRHPYRGRAEKHVSELDDMLFEAAKAGDITSALHSCTASGFEEVSSWLDRSLFFRRMFQVDVFDALSAQNKYVLFKKSILDSTNFVFAPSQHQVEDYSEVCADFLLQVFGTKIVDSSVKAEMYKMLLRSPVAMSTRDIAAYIAKTRFKLGDKTRSLISKAKCISQVMLDLAVQGEDRYDAVALYMLLMKKEKLLREWVMSDPDQVRDCFDIVDIVKAA